MKEYVEPIIEIIKLEEKDIILDSNDKSNDGVWDIING